MGGVHSPAQVIQDVQSEELKVCCPLHLLTIDAQAQTQHGSRLPETSDDLFGLPGVEVQVAEFSKAFSFKG